MTPLDLQHFRRQLIELRDELLEAAADNEESTAAVELDQSRVGRLSRMDAMQGQAMSVEMNRRRKASLKRVDSALDRIEEGEFGDCTECGEPIATQRLELDPAVTLCIRCATEAEQK